MYYTLIMVENDLYRDIAAKSINFRTDDRFDKIIKKNMAPWKKKSLDWLPA